MEKEIVRDDFYKSGPDPKPLKPRRRRRRHVSGVAQFDETQKRKPRKKNRGFRRMLRQLRRDENFRMKILWFLAALLAAGVVAYSIYEQVKWSRIEPVPAENMG